MNENLYDRLLPLYPELSDAYLQSDIRSINPYWSYSLVASSPLLPNQPLILGFNWGAEDKIVYSADTKPSVSKNLGDGDLGSLSRIIPYWERYISDFDFNQSNQTNYCFFRSKKEHQITTKDINLCYPVFEKLLKILRPSIILCFSAKLRNRLLAENLIGSLLDFPQNYMRGINEVTYTTYKGLLLSSPDKPSIYFLPHPNSQIPSIVRESSWGFCFNK